MSQCGLLHNVHLFAWDGVSIEGGSPSVGQTDATVALQVTNAAAADVPARMLYLLASDTLARLRATATRMLGYDASSRTHSLGLVRADKKTGAGKGAGDAFSTAKDHLSLSDLGIASGTHFVCLWTSEPRAAVSTKSGGAARPAAAAQAAEAKDAVRRVLDTVTVTVKTVNGTALDTPLSVSIDANKFIADLRNAVAAAAGVDMAGTRLRRYRGTDSDVLVREELTLKDERIDTGCVVALETGQRPAPGQLLVVFREVALAGMHDVQNPISCLCSYPDRYLDLKFFHVMSSAPLTCRGPGSEPGNDSLRENHCGRHACGDDKRAIAAGGFSPSQGKLV